MDILYYTSEGTLLEEIVYLCMTISLVVVLVYNYIKNKDKIMIICAIIAMLMLSSAFFVKYQKYGFAKDRITYHIEVWDINDLTKHDCKVSHQRENIWTATDCDLSNYTK